MDSQSSQPGSESSTQVGLGVGVPTVAFTDDDVDGDGDGDGMAYQMVPYSEQGLARGITINSAEVSQQCLPDSFACTVCEDEFPRIQCINAGSGARQCWRCKKCHATINRMNNAAKGNEQLEAELRALKRDKQRYHNEVIRLRGRGAQAKEMRSYLQSLSSIRSITTQNTKIELNFRQYIGWEHRMHLRSEEESTALWQQHMKNPDMKKFKLNGEDFVVMNQPREFVDATTVAAERTLSFDQLTISGDDEVERAMGRLQAGTQMQMIGPLFASAGAGVFHTDASHSDALAAAGGVDEATRSLKRRASDPTRADPIKAKMARLSHAASAAADDPFVKRQRALIQKNEMITTCKGIRAALRSLSGRVNRMASPTGENALPVRVGIKELGERAQAAEVKLQETLDKFASMSGDELITAIASFADEVAECQRQLSSLELALEAEKGENKRLRADATSIRRQQAQVKAKAVKAEGGKVVPQKAGSSQPKGSSLTAGLNQLQTQKSKRFSGNESADIQAVLHAELSVASAFFLKEMFVEASANARSQFEVDDLVSPFVLAISEMGQGHAITLLHSLYEPRMEKSIQSLAKSFAESNKQCVIPVLGKGCSPEFIEQVNEAAWAKVLMGPGNSGLDPTLLSTCACLWMIIMPTGALHDGVLAAPVAGLGGWLTVRSEGTLYITLMEDSEPGSLDRSMILMFKTQIARDVFKKDIKAMKLVSGHSLWVPPMYSMMIFSGPNPDVESITYSWQPYLSRRLLTKLLGETTASDRVREVGAQMASVVQAGFFKRGILEPNW